MSSNKHQRLLHLEKLAAIATRNAKTLAARTESDRLSKEVAALTNEELKARYETAMNDFRNAPNLDLANFSTQELINLYTENIKHGT